MAQAKAAAGGKDVMVHGAETGQSCLLAGVLDELEIHLIPVLLGDGRRLFERLGYKGLGRMERRLAAKLPTMVLAAGAALG